MNVIIDFVKSLYNIRNEINPKIRLIANYVPWLENEKNNAIMNIICQDHKEISKYVDIINPMLYHALCYKNLEWINDILNEFGKIINKEIIPSIQCMDEPRHLEINDIYDSIEYAYNNKYSSGITLFEMDSVLKKEKYNIIKAAFKDKNII